MVCLFHGDYGPADPGFAVAGLTALGHRWSIDASLLKGARNLQEAEAIQRHVLRGESVTWCHQGYSWVDQPAIRWFYVAAFIFVVLPWLLMKIKNAVPQWSGSAALRGDRPATELSPDIDQIDPP
jgi:hypothetical protein